MNNHIHFGLTFPPDFPLDEKSRKQIAKILLLNPRISVRKVKNIINDDKLWQRIRLLNEKLDCEISGMSLQESEPTGENREEQFISFLLELLYELFHVAFHDHAIVFKSFNQKLFSWIIEFSFPLPSELKIIADETDIPEEDINDSVYSWLFHRDMSAIKVFDYLGKYRQQLSTQKIDELLDLYTTKSKSNINTTHIQLDMFSDNNHK